MTPARKQTVFVGLSGGVDSSVAAARLLHAGYNVAGVFIKVWQPDFLACNWEAERLDAMRVAATLGIPFYTCDAIDRYKTDVVDYLVREYDAGRTPNPDVMCNKHVKFGAFLDFADQHGTDLIATGHYVRRIDTDHGAQLARGVDPTKDQSYFLWSLTEEQLARSLFPIGEMEKREVRAEAAKLGLPTAQKPDSQGVCFLGQLDMKSFLQHFIPKDPGRVIDESGREVGTHDGARFYTIGQRHGFTISATSTHEEPHYIIAKNIAANTLIVSQQQPSAIAPKTAPLDLSGIVWRSHTQSGRYQAQTRYRQKPFDVELTLQGTAATALPLAAHEAAAPGQSCVLYEGDVCHGGGIINA